MDKLEKYRKLCKFGLDKFNYAEHCEILKDSKEYIVNYWFQDNNVYHKPLDYNTYYRLLNFKINSYSDIDIYIQSVEICKDYVRIRSKAVNKLSMPEFLFSFNVEKRIVSISAEELKKHIIKMFDDTFRN